MPVPARLKPWVDHLTKVRKANPKLSLKEAMILAKKSYRKGGKKGGLMSLNDSFQEVMEKYNPKPKRTAEEERKWRMSLYA